MTDITYKAATLEHAAALADVMRAYDAAEVKAATGETPLEVLERGVRSSAVSVAVFFDDEIAAIFGIAQAETRESALGPSIRCAWFLTGEVVDRHPRTFIRVAKRVQTNFLALCPILYNWVDERYAGAIWLLRHLGVQLSEPMPHGVNGELFRLGIKRRA